MSYLMPPLKIFYDERYEPIDFMQSVIENSKHWQIYSSPTMIAKYCIKSRVTRESKLANLRTVPTATQQENKMNFKKLDD